MKGTLLFLLGMAFFVVESAAQLEDINPCGTIGGRSLWLENYQLNPEAYPKSNQLLFIPMTIHLVGNNQGFGHASLMDVYRAFCTLNEDFAPANIRFYIAGVNTFNNSNLYEHSSSFQALQIMNTQNVPNTINSYFVQEAAGACGYAWLGSDNGIVLKKSCVNPFSHTWAHEVGHFLSLPHTFSGWEGYEHDYALPAPEMIDDDVVEKADGSNCQFSGDGFCDTPADYINRRWSCNANAQSSIIQLDPDSLSFRSDGTLIMSYSNDACANRFSEEQIAAMRANLFDRSYLIDDGASYEPILTEEYSLTSPTGNEVVTFFNNVTLEWPEMLNAERYLVQITPVQTFSIIFRQFETVSNSITVYDLSPNKTYYWRVLPLNPYYACSFSERESFKTGDVASSLKEIPNVTEWKVFPNPVAGHESVGISLFSAQTFDARLTLLDLTGKILRRESLFIVPGNNELSLSLREIPAGMYQIRLEGQGGAFVDKVIIAK